MWRAAGLSLLLLLGLAGLASCSVEPPATVQAAEMRSVWQVFIYAGIAVYAIVAGLILWGALAYPRRNSKIRQAAKFHQNTALEIVWTVIPVLIVAGLFVKTYVVEAKVEHVSSNPAEVVDVIGYRWSWRFTYPRYGIAIDGSPKVPPVLVLPAGETTRVNLTSSDVIHSFWIPAFTFKRDANPGMNNQFDLTPTRTGTYLGRCAEYCGTFHALMDFKVRVVPRDEFARWIRAR